MDFLLKRIEQILRYQKRWKKWQKVVASLACVVVFITTYALILPAITIDRDEAQSQGGIFWEESQEAEETVASADEQGTSQDGILSAEQANLTEEPVEDGNEDQVIDNNEQYPSDGTEEQVGTGIALGENPAEGSTLDSDVNTEKPAAVFDEVAGDVTVHVEAPEGAFPAGTTMRIEPVADEQVMDAVQEAVEEAVTRVSAVDIIFLDTLGNEIEPEAEIRVSMSSSVMENVEQPVIVHVDEEGVAETVESEQMDGAVVFESDRFSVYVMVETETLTGGVVTVDGSTYSIAVTYGPEAKIPSNAILEATEVEETSDAWHEYYDHAAMATGKNSFAFARFFDIRIVVGGEVIEPQAPVETKIVYEGGIPLTPDSDPKAVHFTEEGIEVLEVTLDDEEYASEFTFEQGEYSITGTVVSELAEGDYLIYGYRVRHNNSYFTDKSYTNNPDWAYSGVTNFSVTNYALRYYSGLNSVQLNESSYGRAYYNGGNDGRVLWRVTKSGDGYLLYNTSSGRYLRDNNGTLTAVTSQNQATVWNYENGQLKSSAGRYLVLNYSNNIASFRLSTTQPVGPNIYFAWENEAETGSVTIHYMKDNGDNTYTQTSQTTMNLQNNSLQKGDQYDLRQGIPSGMQYERTLLGDETFDTDATQIHYYLQTNYGVTNNAAIFGGNYRGWLYRETTEWDFDYGVNGWPTNGGVAVTTISAYRSFGDEKDVYVLYREPPEESGGIPGMEDPNAPKAEKNKYDNEDGTYDLSLDITGAASSITSASRANVVVVLDLSYSMLKQDTDKPGVSRLDACKDAIRGLATELMALNENNPDSVEMAYIGFAQRVLNEREINATYTNVDSFMEAVNRSTTAAGTNWDAALEAVNNIQWGDADPLYVIFVTDGEPNGYSNKIIAGQGSSNGILWDSGNYNVGTQSNDENNGAVQSAKGQINELKTSGATVYGIGAFIDSTTDTYFVDKINIDIDKTFRANDTTALEEKMGQIVSKVSNSIGYQDIEMIDGLTGMTSTALVDGTAGNFTYKIVKYTEAEDPDPITQEDLPNGSSDSVKDEETGTIITYTKQGDGTYIKTIKTPVPDSEATVIKNNDGTLTIHFPNEADTESIAQAEYDKSAKKVTWNLGDNYQLRDGYTYSVEFTIWPNQASYDILAALRNGLLEWGDDFDYIDEEGNPQTLTAQEYMTQIQKSGNTYSLRSNVETGNTVTYYKVVNTMMQALPAGASVGESTDPTTGVITIYTRNGNGTYTETIKTPGSTSFVNPDPMPLTGTTVSMTKKWEDSLNPNQLVELIESQGFDENNNPKYFVELNILEGETPYKSYRFYPVKKEEKYVWPVHTVNISPALLVSELPEGKSASDYKTVTLNNTTYYVLNDGHTYNITESNSDYHFEFQADPYHPALVDSVLTNVAFVTDEQGAIISGTEATIREDVPVETIEARNSLTSELDITKKVQDNTHTMSQAEMDAETFTYKVTLTIPYTAKKPDETEEPFNYAKYMNAFEFVPRYNDNLDRPNRYIIHGYQNEDSDKGFNEDVAYFNGKVHGRYTVSYPGGAATLDEIFTPDQTGDGTQTGSIYVTLKRNEVLRFTNLPYGTEYAIEEVYANMKPADPSKDTDAIPSDGDPENNLAAQGYTSVTVKTKHGEDTGTVTGNRVEGTISALNSRFYNQFTNVRTSVTNDVYAEFKVKKVVDGYEWGSEYYNMRLTAGVATYTDSEGGTSTSPMPGLDSVNIYNDTDSHTLSFGNVLYTRPGVYKYTVSEYNNSANMPYVVFADPVEVTVTVTADNSGKLHVSEVTDNSGIENNSVLIPATQTSLDTILTTLTNYSKPIDIVKVSGKTGNVIEGAVFEIHQGSEKLYFDDNGQVLTAAQVLSRISSDGAITDILSDEAIRAMAAQGIKSTITIGEMSLKGLAVTGYTYTDGAFIENTPIVYELVEIKAADGFMITENNNYFKVAGIRDTNETTRVRYKGIAVRLTDAEGHDLVEGEGNPKTTDKNVELSNNAMTITLENAPGAELPHTGGSGKLPYTLSGMILFFTSALMYGFRMRRRERRSS